MSDVLRVKLAAILAEIQKTECNNQKHLINAVNLCKKQQQHADLATATLTHFVGLLVQTGYKPFNVHVERAVEFIASLVGRLPETSGPIYDYVLDRHDLAVDHVRYRVCQFINKLSDKLVDVELSECLLERIEEAMLERLSDPKADVRLQAATALYRLQDPNDPRCRVFRALLKHTQCDASVKVRKMCAEKIAITRESLDALAVRTRDCSSEVRCAALVRLREFPKHLKINDRQNVIVNGLNDSLSRLRNYTSRKLLPSWIADYSNDHLMFVAAIRTDSNESDLRRTLDVVLLVLETLLKRNRGDDFRRLTESLRLDGRNRVVPLERLDVDSVLLWSRLVVLVRKSEPELADTIVPDSVDFVKYVRSYESLKIHDDDDLQRDFVLSQLLEIAAGYDLSDPYTRQTLVDLAGDLLRKSSSVGVLEGAMRCLEVSMASLDRREEFVLRVIDDVRHARVAEEVLRRQTEVDAQIAEIHTTLEQLRLDQAQVIRDQDFETASKNQSIIKNLEKVIADLKDSLKFTDLPIDEDPAILEQCLKIVLVLLRSLETRKLSPTLRTVTEQLVLPNITNVTQEELRLTALECYALCCLIDKDTAVKGVQIFSVCLLAGTSPEADLRLLVLAVKATADLITWYGPGLLKNCVTNEDFPVVSINDVVQVLVDLMDSEEIEVEKVAVTGLCNLILTERVVSPTLISRMTLKWCNPATDEDMYLKQQIGAMLDQLPTLHGAAVHLGKSALLTIKTILKAPPSSPLSEVNVADLVKFCLTLCNICSEASAINYNLAVDICCCIKDDPDDTSDNLILSKALLMLEMDKIEPHMVDDLAFICDGIDTDETVEANVGKFMTNLRKNQSSNGKTEKTNDESIEV